MSSNQCRNSFSLEQITSLPEEELGIFLDKLPLKKQIDLLKRFICHFAPYIYVSWEDELIFYRGSSDSNLSSYTEKERDALTKLGLPWRSRNYEYCISEIEVKRFLIRWIRKFPEVLRERRW